MWRVIRRSAQLLLIALAASASALIQAQAEHKVPRIAQVFFVDPATAKPYDEAFRAGLRTLGYVDGENITIVPRYAYSDGARVRLLVTELVESPVDVLLVSPSAVRVAKEVTSTVPIVCANMLDAVNTGLVPSLSHPGGNLTRLTYQRDESDSKRLELTKELIPTVRRLALLYDATFQSTGYPNAMRALARKQGVALHVFAVRSPEEIQGALPAIERARPQAVLLDGSPRITQYRRTILDYAIPRFPVIAGVAEYGRAGAVIAYSEDDFANVQAQCSVR